jgi:hypothetical protein
MKLRPIALVALVATVGLIACKEDIAGAGEPEMIVPNRATTTLATRTATATITAYTIDQNNRRIPGVLAAQPAAAALALDSTVYVPELAETRFFIRGTAASATGTDLQITGHGLTATTTVIIP